ncbi:helix-turn-helix transcriptional regulator [Streptomyces sulphureus]|uniref:helix-turn-helix transcriptional regulator n=1 Tax=Streptomyces sulphureus TaxID=47758 RepID=UPI000381BAF4|nr:WYL domain-containing protein [Streptomyces sulphureus]
MTPDRFFSLLLALHSRKGVTTRDLAGEVGVSVRTVLRDLRWLHEAGFPLLVERGRAGGVTLLPGGVLDTSRLTATERDHLGLHGLDDGQRSQLGAETDSRRALRKVAAPGQPASALLPLSAVVATDNRPWFGPEARGTQPSALVGDVRRGVRLRIRYRRAEEAEPTWQLVDPYGLLAKGGRWYLVADRTGVPRLYALERLTDWQPTRAPRRLRPDATLRTAAAELTSRWQALDGVRVEAVLRARQLDRARRLLGSRLSVRSAREAEVEVTVACRELEDVRQLLQFGDDLTVTGPPKARARIRDLAGRILRQYP